MGGRPSVEVECEEMRDYEWDEVPEKERMLGRWRTLRNRRTGAMVDEYQLSWPSDQEYSFYLKSFNWRSRRRTNSPIVASIYLKPLCRNDFCSQKYTASIYLEHIGLRLSHIQDVPINQALFVLTEALQGYMQLYQHSGYFRIHEEQICVDRIGKVKVWVNADLSRNYPECDTDCGRNQKDEIDMVQQLLQVVTAATDPQEMPSPSFLDYFDMVRKREVVAIGFEYAKILAIQFAKLHQIRIPARFETVMELLAPQIQPNINKNYSVSNNMETLPSSIELVNPRSQHLPTSPRLNNYHSMPSIHPSSNSTISYHQQQHPNRLPAPYPIYPRPDSNHHPPPDNFNAHQFAAEVQQSLRLQQINSRHFEESSGGQQTKRKSGNSKNSKNSKSQMINLEETTQHHSINFQDSHTQERNTMWSVPNRSRSRRRHPNMEQIHYSQCIGDPFERNYGGAFHQDAFGMVPRRRMKESSSSNRFPSSNSSQSRQCRNSQRLSKNSKKSGSSRRDSNINRNEALQLRIPAMQMPKRQLQYYSSMGEDWEELDPEIEADIRKYLGE